MKKYLDHVTNVLKELEVSGAEKCSMCGKEGSHEMVLLNNVAMSLCQQCFDNAREESLQSEQEFATTNKHYMRGFLGAILGGIIGAIPWMILSYFGWFAAPFGLLIGYASLKGYKILGGQPGRATRWIVLGVTLFSIIFAEVATFTYAIMVVYEIPFSFDIVFFIITTPEILKDMALKVLLGWIMGFLGVYQLFKNIKHEVDSAVVKVEKG